LRTPSPLHNFPLLLTLVGSFHPTVFLDLMGVSTFQIVPAYVFESCSSSMITLSLVTSVATKRSNWLDVTMFGLNCVRLSQTTSILARLVAVRRLLATSLMV